MRYLGISEAKLSKGCGGFHSHASALHQAVASGSSESVKLLVKAGADLSMRDRVYDGTPLDWAIYMPNQEGTDGKRKPQYREIEEYLRLRLSSGPA